MRYAEATGLADQVTALKAVDFIAIANILDGRGLGLVNSTITPANSGNSWGFSLNGVTYEFQNNDFPEFQELTALDSVLYTRAKEGEKREISDELHQKVLDRLAESFSVSERLGKGPSYHAR